MISFFLDIYEKSGFILLPLLLLAIFGWFYIIDVVGFLFFEKNQKIKDFLKIKNTSIKFVTKKNEEEKKIYFQEQTDFFLLSHLGKYHHHLNTVKFIAGLAPLLGLLGTVNGMVKTFTVISLYGSSNPIFLADGISEALITTQMGLAISFPLLFFRVIVHNKLKEVPLEIEKSLSSF